MYFALTTDGAENVYMAKERGLNSHIGLGMGRAWDVAADEIDLPYRFTMTVVEDEDPRMDAWFPGSHLMSKALLDTLVAAGVDNLQTFPAEVHREDSDASVPGYVVANIVGRIACAAMAQSETSPLADVAYFHRLTISPERAQGRLLFRLDESPMVVLVHETIARVIRAGDFPGLVLEPVEEALGS